MSFFQANTLTSLSSHFDEDQWVKLIRQTLDEELEEDAEVPVTIFAVPKPLMITDPESYIPQQVAIGPYHHLRPELYDMERYKISAAKRHQRDLQDIKLKEFVDHLTKYELRIRACYHRPLNYGCEALAWIMAVDATFLFEFFQVCGIKKGKVLTREPSKLAHLIDASGNKTVHNGILKDITMLENQIPLFVMRMLLEFQCSSLEVADGVLSDMMLEISKELSPFKMVKSSKQIEVKRCAHLLSFLYHFIAPELGDSSHHEAIEIHEIHDQEADGGEGNKDSFEKGHVTKLVDEVWKILSPLIQGPIGGIKRILSKPLKLIVKLPCAIISKIPILSAFKEPIEHMFTAYKEKGNDDDDNEDDPNPNPNMLKPPLLEEITIPSVTQLIQVGIQFLPTKEGIQGIHFDLKTLTLSLPIIDLDVNSEVVLRNLVAYESCTASKRLILARYTELMNGIIDTESDVGILCQKGIIINHLKSEKEVADMWNGMSKSIKLTKVPSMDQAIAEVNKYYSSRWKVKLKKMMDQYVFGSWRILTFLATIAMLLLMTLQAFCQVYTCSRFLHIKAFETPPTD